MILDCRSKLDPPEVLIDGSRPTVENSSGFRAGKAESRVDDSGISVISELVGRDEDMVEKSKRERL